ncbi:MAG: hypothetical protein Q4C77_06490 [Eubacteriales bacterium]|nr:hypothetical protein [Eubacteriales bacterium]
MRQVLAAWLFLLGGFFRNIKTAVGFLISVVVCFLLSGTVVEVTKYYGTSTQAAEPFLWTFGDGTAVLLVSLLLIFLFSDLPGITAFTPFYLVRMTKKRWLAAQFLYILAVTVLYVVFVLGATMLLCMKNSYIENVWSETAAILGYSGAGEVWKIPSTVRAMESIRPYGCMLQAALLMLGYGLTLGVLILFGNLRSGKNYGMLFAMGYSLYGFLLDPKVLGKLLKLETYEMYRVRSAVGWISPLNHAVYSMHDFGYDNLPGIWQSVGLFSGITAVLCVLSCRVLKKYPFTFLGS